jgi:hypothetical protein
MTYFCDINQLLFSPLNLNFALINNKKQQHAVFLCGHPSQYWTRPTLLDFSDRTGTGTANVVWLLLIRIVTFIGNQSFVKNAYTELL